MIRLKSIHSILLFQKTDGSAQTSRHYHWVDGHQPNRFKPTQIYLNQTCLLLGEDKNMHTKYIKKMFCVIFFAIESSVKV